MKRVFFLAALMFFAGLSGETPEELAEKRAAAYDLFEAQGMRDQMNQIIAVSVNNQLKEDPKYLRYYPQLHAFYQKCSGFDALKTELADLYLKYFTVQELKEMAAFYRTPVGQKMRKVSAEILMEANKLSQSRIEKNTPAFLEEIRRQAEQESKQGNLPEAE